MAWIATTAIVFIFLYFNLALFRPLIIYEDFRSTGFGFSVLFFLAWLVFVLSFRKIDRILRRQVFEQQDLLKRFRRELITLRNQTELFDRIEQIFLTVWVLKALILSNNGRAGSSFESGVPCRRPIGIFHTPA